MARQELMAAAVLLGAAALGASAQGLGVGDAAPKLAVKEFIKGKPVAEFETGKIYVIEFWYENLWHSWRDYQHVDNFTPGSIWIEVDMVTGIGPRGWLRRWRNKIALL